MLCFQSNTTYISFRDTGYMFWINQLLHHLVSYKINSKNVNLSTCFFFVGSPITINITIKIVIVKHTLSGYYYNFVVKLTVMWEPTRKNTTHVLKLTCIL